MRIEKAQLVFKDTLQRRTSTDFFIVHHADATNCDIYDIQKWHLERGFIGVGYNYFIDKNGVVWEGRPEWASDADARGHNYDSLSVCLEGRFTHEHIQDKQKDALVDLMAYVKGKYPKIKFMRHKDVNPTNCPGDIPFLNILKEVEDKIRVNNSPKHDEIEELKKELEETKQHLGQLQSHFYALDRKVDRILSMVDRKLAKVVK